MSCIRSERKERSLGVNCPSKCLALNDFLHITEKLSCFIDVLIDYNEMSSKFPTVAGDYDRSDDFYSVCHFGGGAFLFLECLIQRL